MKTRSTHIIQRYVFELTTSATDGGLDWEKQAYHFAQDIMVRGLEESFQKVDHVERQVIIDKLEIDLGSFLHSTFQEEALKRLIPLVGKQLEVICDGNETPGRATDPQEKPMDKYHGSNEENSTVSKLSPSQALYLGFVNFLNLGRFPWWYEKPDRSSGMDEQFNLEWVRSLGQKEKQSLKDTLISVHAARIRLADNFEKEWLGEFLQVIGLSGREALNHWRLFISSLLPLYERYPLLHQHYWTSWMASFGKPGPFPYLKPFLGLAAEGDIKRRVKLIKALRETCEKRARDPASNKDLKSLMAYLETNIVPGLEGGENNLSGQNEPKMDPGMSWDPESLDNRGNRSDRIEKTNGKETPEKPDLIAKDQSMPIINGQEDSFFVEGAGLVLLHPFLPELFKENRLWIDNRWQSGKSPLKAVRLLSCLSFGEEEVNENQLILHKILAGLEADTLLSAGIFLRKEEMESCEELLQAVIGHWKALRSTTPQGLREGFIRREGKLTIAEDSFRLHIEAKTEDILLSRIPWGFGMIRLPWMQRTMHVKWI